MDFDNLMDFAVRTASRAGEITLRHFGSVATERKGDGSEVTAADRESERFILDTLADAFPADGVLGEEGGSSESRSGRRWIVDPIDATRSFSAGVPLYGVLIALEEQGVPLLGCCHLPALGETIVAARGAGAWRNGARTRVSAVEDFAEARVVTSGMEYWRDWATTEGQEGWTRLVAASRFARTWGDCYGYVLVATARAEIMADPAAGAPWDYLPMIPILEEAGGQFTTFGGSPIGAWRSALATNGRLHEAAMGCWAARERGDSAVQIPAILERQGS
jgi:histidinol phosphatase-like enzyme (inositol monophosphatase family)